MVTHTHIQLPAYGKGFHLITEKVMEQLSELPDSGLLNLFVLHTSAGLTINENADPSVRKDLNEIFNHLVPEDQPYYTHIYEGSDDMPAHAKSIMCGSSITIPVQDKKLMLGTWQGIYLCEFRYNSGGRKLIASVYA